MVEPEPEEQELPAETQLSVSIVHPRMDEERPIGLGMCGAGPSHPRIEEGRSSKPSIQQELDTNLLVQMMIQVARNVMHEALAQTNPPNQNLDRAVPRCTEIPPL